MFPANTKILIVDDMLGLRQLLKSQLKTMGFNHFVESDNGEFAYALLVTELEMNQPVGLVISDWNMPGMSGMELLQRIRSNPRFAELPFLMVTAEGELKQVISAIQAGVSDYMVKPFSAEILSRKLAAAWAKHQALG